MKTLLIGIAAVVASLGCTETPHPHKPFTVLRKAGEFSVISEEHYSEKAQWANYYFKIGTQVFGNDTYSPRLFPPSSECHHPYYDVTDVRLSDDNAVIALLSAINTRCPEGSIHLATFDVDPIGQLRVRRLVPPSSVQITSLAFKRVDKEGLRYGYEGHEERLAIQADPVPSVGILTTIRDDDTPTKEGALAVFPKERRLVDLGEGYVVRALDDESVLMQQPEGANPPSAITFKQVQLRTGNVLSSVRLTIADFRPASKELVEAVAARLSVIEGHDAGEYEYAIERGRQATKPSQSRVTDFGAKTLPANALKASCIVIAEDIEKTARAELIEGQLRVTTSQGIRRIR